MFKKISYISCNLYSSKDYKYLRHTFGVILSIILTMLTLLLYNNYLYLLSFFGWTTIIALCFNLKSVNYILHYITMIILMFAVILIMLTLLVYGIIFTCGYMGLISSYFINYTKTEYLQCDMDANLCKMYPRGLITNCNGPINTQMVHYALNGVSTSNITDHYYKNVHSCFVNGVPVLITILLSCIFLLLIIVLLPDIIEYVTHYCKSIRQETSTLTSDIEAVGVKIDG